MKYTRVCVCLFPMYRDIWQAAVGEVLDCEREPEHAKDRYAVAVKKDVTVIGHLLCSLYLRRERSIQCIVTSRHDIPSLYCKEALRFRVQ